MEVIISWFGGGWVMGELRSPSLGPGFGAGRFRDQSHKMKDPTCPCCYFSLRPVGFCLERVCRKSKTEKTNANDGINTCIILVGVNKHVLFD